MTSSGEVVEVTALAITVDIPTAHRWSDTRRGEEFTLTTLTIRLLPDGHLAVKAYGRPTAAGATTSRSRCLTTPSWLTSSRRRPIGPARCGHPTAGWAEPRRAV